MTTEADARPDWADQTRGQCPTCRDWIKLTKAGLVVKHMRSEPGRWRKVPCEGSRRPPLPEPAADHHARLAAGTEPHPLGCPYGRCDADGFTDGSHAGSPRETEED